jgi:hypothetical protein
MAIVAALDELGTPIWLLLMVLGFIFFWPLGLAILAYLLWSGRMGCWRRASGRGWHDHRDRLSGAAGRWCGGMGRAASSGNSAFDDYRTETLRRLEEEEREFRAFLERLRRARDKAEFDQFLAERRSAFGQAPPTEL